MHHRTGTKSPPSLPLFARSDHFSTASIRHALRPPLSRPCVLVLALSGLGMLIMTANFMFTLRATSFAFKKTRVLENHVDIDQTMGRIIDVLKGGKEVPDSSYRPPPLDYRDSSFSADDVNRMEEQLVYTIHETAQRTIDKRGIVLPLFDDIAALGVSLILELRAMDVLLPIEIPHCGDLKDSTIRTVLEQEEVGVLHFYDVCELASETVSLLDASVKVFCESLSSCYELFQSFDIKILAVIFSRFEEVMLLDADTLFFESPMSLWDTDKYQNTGTLFFHDRLVEDKMFMGNLLEGSNGDARQIHDFMSRFDVSPFRPLGHIERPKATSENKVPVTLRFSPSEQLLTSHSWNYRAGHEMDSSLVLWNKKRQPRATAILGAFVARNSISRPPSYGDKELFFVAAELAETQYAFSDYGTGATGQDFRDAGPGKSVLCGYAAHYYPVKPKDERLVATASVLYLNSDDILVYDPRTKPLYYTQARLYEEYPGNAEERGLLNMCPFDVTGVRFSSEQENRMQLRQRFHEFAKAWME
uniref:Nucleotide-diphospho-sugar transferase n=1 Tax=Peronospora matthiolae TaxID=2874970 RepID=A0AAV1TQ21_9STRA